MSGDRARYNTHIQVFARPLGATMVILGLTVLAIGAFIHDDMPSKLILTRVLSVTSKI